MRLSSPGFVICGTTNKRTNMITCPCWQGWWKKINNLPRYFKLSVSCCEQSVHVTFIMNQVSHERKHQPIFDVKILLYFISLWNNGILGPFTSLLFFRVIKFHWIAVIQLVPITLVYIQYKNRCIRPGRMCTTLAWHQQKNILISNRLGDAKVSNIRVLRYHDWIILLEYVTVCNWLLFFVVDKEKSKAIQCMNEIWIVVHRFFHDKLVMYTHPRISFVTSTVESLHWIKWSMVARFLKLYWGIRYVDLKR